MTIVTFLCSSMLCHHDFNPSCPGDQNEEQYAYPNQNSKANQSKSKAKQNTLHTYGASFERSLSALPRLVGDQSGVIRSALPPSFISGIPLS